MSIPNRLISAVFARVFRVPKDVGRQVGPQLGIAIQGLMKIGTKRLKEFLAALPIFLLFVHELLRQRSQVHAQKQLVIIGAAAAFSTLVLVLLGGLLSSLPVQLLLLITHPFIGVPLLVSEGLVITAVMVFFVWIIIYVLNLALEDDPAYQRIRDQFLPESTRAVLSNVQTEIENSGVDLDELVEVVEERLNARGSKADTEKLERQLLRFEKRFRSKASAHLAEAARDAELEPGTQLKA